MAWTCLALLWTLGVAPCSAAQTDPNVVKASFLQRFGGFVRWPDTARATDLCVLGPQSSYVAVRRIAQDMSEIRYLSAPADLRACRVAYLVGAEEEVRLALRSAANLPILTVTDHSATPNVRGVIHFVIVDNRVRFYIDEMQAAFVGLQIDSRLLNLAVSVRRRA